jgi:hypothetical protein
MLKLFTGSCSALMKLVFKIYDFEEKGKIDRKGIKTVFSYLPLDIPVDIPFANLKSFKYENQNFEQRLKSQEEQYKYIEIMFSESDSLTFDEFVNKVENDCSEVFIYVIYLNYVF